jgi:NitT/TauT family transport system ATP-binding protein
MQQRLAIVRALSTAPDLLLMDEPFSNLDAMTRESLQETLSAVHSRHRSTVLIVTHSIEEAAYLADTVTIMAGRTPGRIGTHRATENPHCGPAWRRSPAFFAITAALRAELESQP